MRILHLGGATSVADPVHGTAEAGPDGVFDLPHPFAEHLLKSAAGTWRGEAEHVAWLARNELEELRDPKVALRVLSDLRARVTSLEATVAGLQAPAAPDASVAAGEAGQQSAEPGAQAPATPDPELTPAQKAAATRAANRAAATK